MSFLFTLHVCAKSLQSCPTLCDPMDCSPWSYVCQWDSPGKNTGVCYHAVLQGITMPLMWPALAWSFFTSESPRKPFFWLWDPVNNPLLWPPDVKSWLIWKEPDAGRDWEQDENGMTEDEMIGWHHRVNGHEFGWTPGVGDGQGGRPGVLRFMGSQRVGHDWETELKLSH